MCYYKITVILAGLVVLMISLKCLTFNSVVQTSVASTTLLYIGSRLLLLSDISFLYYRLLTQPSIPIIYYVLLKVLIRYQKVQSSANNQYCMKIDSGFTTLNNIILFSNQITLYIYMINNDNLPLTFFKELSFYIDKNYLFIFIYRMFRRKKNFILIF